MAKVKEEELYAEWLAYKNCGESGKAKLIEMGYAHFTKKEFCEINGIGINTPANWEDPNNSDFWDMYYEKVGYLRVDLPAIIKIMGKKNPESWLKVMFPKQAREAFAQKIEHSGGIDLNKAKGMLGESFIIDDDMKEKEKEA